MQNPEIVSKSANFGPGTWFCIHVHARNSKTQNQKEAFIKFINNICQNLKCGECNGHCHKYIEEHPPNKFMNVIENNEDIGMFMWSWMFHNAVNKRIGKKIMDWKTALMMYS